MKDADKTVDEVLATKVADIMKARLPKGSRPWDDIRYLTMEQIERAAKANEPGMKTILRLLRNKRFDKR